MPLHLAPVNLILIMVIVAVLLSDLNLGLGLALTGGLLLDFVSGAPDGLLAFSILGVFLLMYFIVNTLLAREPSQIILFTSVAAGTLAYFILFLLANVLLHSGTLDIRHVLAVQLPLMLLFNLIFTYPVYQYYLWVQNLTSKFGKHEQPIRNQ